MPDSRLNGAEQALQLSFMKSPIFNGLLVPAAVWAAYLPIRDLPDRHLLPAASLPLAVQPVGLDPVAGPLRLAGAWILDADDRRFGGLSALAMDGDRFLAVTDRGAVVRFDRPVKASPEVLVMNLAEGPGPFGEKWTRDAESLAPDPGGRGWWVGYEQNHSLWLYDRGFQHPLESIRLDRANWWNNRGAEGLFGDGDGLLVAGENGRDAVRVGQGRIEPLAMSAGADVADAALAPDGSAWLLLRTRTMEGIGQAIAPLLREGKGYRSGPPWRVPKGAFDNFEGMAIEARPGGGWRFWLVSDDGHRIMARTLLVALDHVPPAGHNKNPATGAGLSKRPAGKKLKR